jgi:hypothetical protein
MKKTGILTILIILALKSFSQTAPIAPKYIRTDSIGGFTDNTTLYIQPRGTGKIALSGLLFPSSDGTSGQVLSTDGAGVLSWTSGSGNVSKVGTPVDNQVGVWTGDGTIEGSSTFTFNAGDLNITGSATIDDININGTTILNSTGAVNIESLAISSNDISSSTTNVTFTDDVLPFSDNTYDLGSGAQKWEYLYVNNIVSISSVDIDAGTLYAEAINNTSSAATGNEVVFDFSGTVNKATSGNYTGIKLNVTETSAPGTGDLLMDAQVGGVSKFSIDNSGGIIAGSFNILGTAIINSNGGITIDDQLDANSQDVININNITIDGNTTLGTLSGTATALLGTTSANIAADVTLGSNLSIVSGKLVQTIPYSVALSAATGDIATGTDVYSIRMPYAATLTGVKLSIGTAPVGSTVIVDINEAGTTILSTKLSIDASETTSATAATAAVISDAALADDAIISFDIDQVGSSTAGVRLLITLYLRID